MKKMSWYFILLTMGITLTACTTNEPPAPENSTPPTEEEQNDEDVASDEDNGEKQATNDFEPEIEDTIEIEGMEEPITLNLYDNDAAPFITYIPNDFVAEESSDEEGESYWFYANYQDEKIEEANLHVYFFSEAVTEEPSHDEDGTFAVLLEDMELVNEEEKNYEWAIDEYQRPEGSQQAILGEHEGQYFVMILNSTVEYSEGFYPRVNKIIDYFYWKDTQEYLMQ